MTVRQHDAPTAQLLDFDREHLWHPYTSMTDPLGTQLVTGAQGVRLRLPDGREVVDAMSSWWCAIHGYRHPDLDAALHAQVDQMSHVMFGGLTHEPAIRLGQRLVDITPTGLERVFLADSGSVSVEVALKMALQYHQGRSPATAGGAPQRTRVLALRGAYHGDTFGAMSVCDPVGGMHSMFTGVLAPQLFAPRPPGGFDADISAWADEVATLVDRHADELAAIIVEPVLQGAGGMHVYNPDCLGVLRDLADRCGALLVFDEIATGFGRTGAMFAADHAAVVPDLMCVGKALTGGYMTLAAVVCTDQVAQGISGSASGVLMHGPTFMGNPLACAVAGASIDLLLAGDWETQVRRIEAALQSGLAPAAELPGVREVRVLGAVGVVHLEEEADVAALSARALEQGVWVRPFRDLVYTMPPYITDDDDIARICAAIQRAVTVG
ncbi:MAG TPA: adenosylmethionine--8-amino-7-oxononanoate transaminase [Nocardioidaceae bacterium]|nr:adenosylmethionine--8-amino-7-oxononanoate transaminase [Nocardioidaceae bacterium]